MKCFCCDLPRCWRTQNTGFVEPLSHRHNCELGLCWALKETKDLCHLKMMLPTGWASSRREEHTGEKIVSQPHSLTETSAVSPRTKDHTTCHDHLSVRTGNPLYSGSNSRHHGNSHSTEMAWPCLHGKHISKKVFPFGLGPVAKVVGLNTWMALFLQAKHKTRNWATFSEAQNLWSLAFQKHLEFEFLFHCSGKHSTSSWN